MRANTQPSKKIATSLGNTERDRRIKKVGKAPHHKPKYKHQIFNTED